MLLFVNLPVGKHYGRLQKRRKTQNLINAAQTERFANSMWKKSGARAFPYFQKKGGKKSIKAKN